MDAKKPVVLVAGKVNPRIIERLGDRFELVHAEKHARLSLGANVATEVRGAVVSGDFPTDWMAELPKLEIIGSFGVGYDGVDVREAAARGITVTNTPDVLNDEVADTAIGLLINTVRQLPRAEDWLRGGNWVPGSNFPLSPLSLKGRKVGIFGLGRIGLEIARRLEGFKVAIGYHTRSRRDDVPYTYYPGLLSMAEAVDTLICIVPKTPETHKAINAEVLSALGPRGVLINVGRGWSVDETALIGALEKGIIAAAGLDVFYDEPHVPAALMEFSNVCLLPHVASASVDTRNAMADLVADNLHAWFAEGRALTPVPETPIPPRRN
ncbi:2-hydroxyacid dehydrogenase [Rhizobiaceae bacterium n13]|uniref:2-hydroxyacid dehydrogenase n=1 Tax=Ferirhizobium litorale TaxID=2927786 RepID=A0AAE3Q9A1_9HYPH|nr:2-hydroxyacid dehydrogenase [Fererhizobium litorale]MDI7860461.1 2-hydroxyacid dehydrogenase [Fererhizobium litorale]MDI7920596.1 2-hydroxyacid dehydrogenase [Fererhizobium litorale]